MEQIEAEVRRQVEVSVGRVQRMVKTSRVSNWNQHTELQEHRIHRRLRTKHP